MSDEPRRLLESADPRVALTLRSALRDEPSNESIARAARALGVGAAAMSTVTAATAAARAAAHAGQGVSVGAAVGKWLAIGFLVGGAGAAGSTWVLQSSPAPAPSRHAGSQLVTAQSRLTSVAPTSRAQASAIPTASVAPPTNVGPSRDAARVLTQRGPLNGVSSRSESSRPIPSGSASAEQSVLAADLDFLSRARNALKNGDANATLATLSRRERELPVRALDAEATLLRVQALIAAGRSAEARAVARAALNGSSESAYACRLASIASVDAPSCSGKR